MNITHNKQVIRKQTTVLSIWVYFIVALLFTIANGFLAPQVRAVCLDGCAGTNTYQGENAGSVGTDNTAIGNNTLFSNTTTGIQNTAIGSSALTYNTTGYNNTAVGHNAMKFNTTAIDCTAVGASALGSNLTGNHNTAVGLSALTYTNSGGQNTATGTSAMFYNTVGNLNTANGLNALLSNTGGSNNTAIGASALGNSQGSNNIALGGSAGINIINGSNNIEIGSAGTSGDGSRIRIGTNPTHKNTWIAGIWGVIIPTGISAIIDSTGHLGTTTSSARFKDEIKPMDKASESILSLQPVSFRYKKDLDPEKLLQFGLVAEQVEKVNPALVAHDEEGKPYSVRYEAVNAMLLNEFLKEHRKVERLEGIVLRQEEQIKTLLAGMKQQAAQIQKVSAELALHGPVSRLATTEK